MHAPHGSLCLLVESKVLWSNYNDDDDEEEEEEEEEEANHE